MGRTTDVDGCAAAIYPTFAHRPEVVGIDFEPYRLLFGRIVEHHKRGCAAQRLGQHYRRPAVQNPKRLVRPGIHRHPAFEVAITGFGKFDTQQFYN